MHKQYPGKLLAYNCSPSFNWEANIDEATIAKFQRELGAMGYKFQFVTLAGFHSLNHGMFELARGYKDRGMAAYSELQQAEFASEAHGYSATRHQREVGTGYFDEVAVRSPAAPLRPPRWPARPRPPSSKSRPLKPPCNFDACYACRGASFRCSVSHASASNFGVSWSSASSEEKTKGGIIIPDTVKEKPKEGKVIAVALGGRDENGKLTPSTSRPAIAFSSESGPAAVNRT